MGTHMKTTIELPDPLFKQARRYAEAHHITMKALMEQGLRTVLTQAQAEAKPFRLRDASVEGTKLSPEFHNAGWEQIRDIIYDSGEGRG